MEIVLDDQLHHLAVEEVGREHDLGRMGLLPGLVTCGERAVDFARTHRIDEHAVATHQVEDGEVGAGLLSVADGVELL